MGHDAALHQRLDHIGHTLGHTVRQFLNHNGFRQLNVAHDLLAGLHAAHGFLPGALLLAFHRGHGPLTTAFAARKRLVQRQLAGAAVVGAILRAGVTTIIVALAVGLAFDNLATGLSRRRFRGLGIGRGRCCGGRFVAFGALTLGGLFGLPLGAFVGLGLGLERFFALAVLAVLGFDLGAAALALHLACLFLGLALRSLIGLARFRGREGSQAPFHLRVGNTGRT